MLRFASLSLLLTLAACTEEITDKASDAPFEVGDPGKADGALSTADRERLIAAFDAAITKAEVTVSQLESEIAQLEQSAAQKQQEADQLVQQIAAREQEIKDNFRTNLLICAFFPNPGTCSLGVAIQNDSQMTDYKAKLAAAQAQQQSIAQQIAKYTQKRDAIRANVTEIRAGKTRLLDMLAGNTPHPPAPPELAADPAAQDAFWRLGVMNDLDAAVVAEVGQLVTLRNLAVELDQTIDESILTIHALEASVDKIVEAQRKTMMDLIIGLTSGDPAAKATKFLDQQIAAKTRSLLGKLDWPLDEFVKYLLSARGEGNLNTLYKNIFQHLLDDAAPRTYSAETPVNILDHTRADSSLTVTDDRPAEFIDVTVEIEHTYINDLTISLEHGPDSLTLRNRSGGSGKNLTQTFRIKVPHVALKGAWTVHVADDVDGDIGRLVRWDLVAY
ncbi:MAG TPA: proprotein convertase P-domain-containing protein [Kofleriaceae bacterium]|jgi:hypothetical protein